MSDLPNLGIHGLMRYLSVYYFENPLVPQYDQNHEPCVFHMQDEGVYVVHPENTSWFVEGVRRSNRIPVAIGREEWAVLSLAHIQVAGGRLVP